MSNAVITNPIINTPFAEPDRHFRFDDDGITNDVVSGRRASTYFVPIPKPKKKNPQQLMLDLEVMRERVEENRFINDVRRRVGLWRQAGYPHVTPTTKRLLDHWRNAEREQRLFFCQLEAIETAIYLAEAARSLNDAWIENRLHEVSAANNPGLFRVAFKMATGSGKTVVMALLIAWQALNKQANPKSPRYSDAFLIVAPGITIRDRLRVLLPSDPESYYRARDLVPEDWMPLLQQAKVLITNYHAFRQRETSEAKANAKRLLNPGQPDALRELPAQMVRRVCRDLGNKKNIIVLNDEAHHCYRRPPGEAAEEGLKGDERKEAERRNEEARLWLAGLEAVNERLGIRVVYDLSATPFFLRGSGHPEGLLFPWVVSDFSLIDAIEAGLVKIPRVPISDNAGTGDLPTFRELWVRIRDHLPKKGRKDDAVTGEPRLPIELEAALQSLYANYSQSYERWHAQAPEARASETPPVFIVVCNNTNVSKLIYDFVAGWEKEVAGQRVVVPGQLAIFNNEHNGAWSPRPSTILVDSEQLESGDAMSNDFKKIAAREIEDFKTELRQRYPGRDVEGLTDEDLLREVMNTVGKAGKLGEHVKCVVSVSMLTEGWDANTVTHILGVRAFGTQLLCEQVVGRALRRMSYVPNDQGRFEPEYAEVYGIPFSFIPASGAKVDPKPALPPTRVRALPERDDLAIVFPRVVGYRYDLPSERLNAKFTEDSRLTLTTRDFPTETENAAVVGEHSIHTLELRNRRVNEVAFNLSRHTLEKYFRTEEGDVKPWLFPQLLAIAKRWLDECLVCHDDTYPQLLLLTERRERAMEKIYRALVVGEPGQQRLKPILSPYNMLGSTHGVQFDTRKPIYTTRPDKCHLNYMVADTGTWEQKVAQSLEGHRRVRSYVKNQNLGFTIPYVMDGVERQYIPDFVAHIDDGGEGWLHLIVEVTGAKKADKEAKVGTARNLWVPAINNHGGFGRWAFIELNDPWNAQNELNVLLNQITPPSA